MEPSINERWAGDADEIDREMIASQLATIARQLLKDFPIELPGALLFPDISARPLAHAFGPLIRKIQEMRSNIRPVLRNFIGIDRNNDEHLSIINERLQSIRHSLIAQNLPVKVAVIDEYLHRGSTIRNLHRALRSMDRSAPFYILRSGAHQKIWETLEGINIFTVVEDEGVLEGRRSDDYFFRKHEGIGLKKLSDGTIVRDPAVNLSSVQKLRKVMREIGEDAATQL